VFDMPAASHSTTIAAPPERVFAFIADQEHARAWRPAVLDIKLVSGSGLGARYAQGIRGPAGRRLAADFEVTTYEPPARYGFRGLAGPVRPDGLFVIEPTPDGSRLTLSISAELGGLTGLLLGRSVQRTMEAETRAIEGIGPLLARPASADPPPAA
jgi:uncharacterized protein YndB with AHSA1/START domain